MYVSIIHYKQLNNILMKLLIRSLYISDHTLHFMNYDFVSIYLLFVMLNADLVLNCFGCDCSFHCVRSSV